jgi:hypothetical protein
MPIFKKKGSNPLISKPYFELKKSGGSFKNIFKVNKRLLEQLHLGKHQKGF